MTDVLIPAFTLTFSRRYRGASYKYLIPVYIHDVTPATFARREYGRWGCFDPVLPLSLYGGHFGDLHFLQSRLRHGLIAHEINHAVTAWFRLRAVPITGRTEEAACILLDALVSQFYRRAKAARLVVK